MRDMAMTWNPNHYPGYKMHDVATKLPWLHCGYKVPNIPKIVATKTP
jgi:hypothetical protein